MSYRNDHDAALLRVAALEREVAHLRTVRRVEPLRAPHRARTALTALAIALTSGIATLVVTHTSGASPEAPTPPDSVADATRAVLRRCIAAIAPLPGPLTAASTDPHSPNADSIAPIFATAAGCRDELAFAIRSRSFDPPLQEVLERWRFAEDALCNRIWLIATYYASSPYLSDRYQSAQQLWREFHAAHDARDIALRSVVDRL